MESNEDDKALKEAINSYVFGNKIQLKSSFLKKEVIKLISDGIGSHPNINMKLLKHSVKYGYSLPLAAMKKVADALDNAVTKTDFYKAGFTLIVTSEGKEVINYKTKPSGKMTLRLEAYQGNLYLCQQDFQENTGLPGAEEGKPTPFVFEAYISKFKHLAKKFVKNEETMRNMILKEL